MLFPVSQFLPFFPQAGDINSLIYLVYNNTYMFIARYVDRASSQKFGKKAN